MIGKHFITIAAAVILTSCSTILEDRGKCACSLSIDCSQIGAKTKADGFHFRILAEDGSEQHKYFYDKNEYQNKLSFSVPREEIIISAFNSIQTQAETETDSLYLYYNKINCSCESVTDTIRFYKQWCTLALETVGEPLKEEYKFRIEGNWDGKEVIDYSPSAGNYSCTFRSVGENKYQIRIPRQGDDQLSLLLYYEDSDKEIVVFNQTIGLLLAAKGYDWTKRNLDDVDLLYDFQSSSVKVEVISWDTSSDSIIIDF